MKLYRQFFEQTSGHRLKPPQAVYAAVMFEGRQPADLVGEEREIARTIFGPVDHYPDEARAVGATLKGARIGGTMMWAYHLLLGGLTIPAKGLLAPGEPLYCVIVATKLKAARQAFRYVLGAIDKHPNLQTLVLERTKESVTIQRPDGILLVIEAVAAGHAGENLRSRTLGYVLIDEACFFFDEATGRVVTIEELFRAAHTRILHDTRPRRGAQLGIVSTAWTTDNMLWRLVEDNRVANPTECIAGKCPTLFMLDTPRNRQAERFVRLTDEANADREFYCIPLALSSDKFFPGPSIDASVNEDLFPVHSAPLGTRVFIGGDVAQAGDATAFVVIHERAGLLTVAEVVELRPMKRVISMREICDTGAALAKRHGATRIEVDHYQIHVARELMPPGIQLHPVPGGQLGKMESHLRAKECLTAGRVRIPAEFGRLINQIREVRAKPTPGGGIAFQSPRRPGEHGDIASAFVLAVWAAARAGRAGLNLAPRERKDRDEFTEREPARRMTGF